jgi:hypothetical protein
MMAPFIRMSTNLIIITIGAFAKGPGRGNAQGKMGKHANQ